MRFLRRWLSITALVAASAWVYLFTAATLQLGTLLDSAVDTTADPHSTTGKKLQARAAEHRPPRTAVADRQPSATPAAVTEFDAPPESTDDLSSAQLLRLLADELETETDPEAADAFLREFGETLDAPKL